MDRERVVKVILVNSESWQNQGTSFLGACWRYSDNCSHHDCNFYTCMGWFHHQPTHPLVLFQPHSLVHRMSLL